MVNELTTAIDNADIRGLDKAIVLLNLYNNADFAGPIWDSQPTRRAQKFAPGSLDRAVSLIKGRADFDYLDLGAGSRPLKISLATNALNVTEYNRHHGEKRAQKIIIMLQTLKTTGLVPQNRSDPGRNSLFYAGPVDSEPSKPAKKSGCCTIL